MGAECQQALALDEGEDLEVVKMPMTRVLSEINGDSIDNGMTLLAFYYFWMHQKTKKDT